MVSVNCDLLEYGESSMTSVAQIQVKPFALICSFRVPSTELNPDFVPSIHIVVGEYETQEQAKQARYVIDSPALISAGLY